MNAQAAKAQPVADDPQREPDEGAAPCPDNATEQPQPENPATAAFRVIPQLLSEIRSYASHYFAARIDRVRVTARNIAVYAVLGILGLIMVAGIVCTAIALLLVGIAHALGALLGQRMWLGDLIVGFLVLAVIVLAVYIPIARIFQASRKTTELKYEGRRIQQRVKHGRDVHDRAVNKDHA